MNCDCAKELDKLLKPRGEELDLAFDTTGREFYIVKLRKITGGKGRLTLMLAKYCPFCGKQATQ